MNTNTDIISSIVYIVITVLLALITRYLVPWFKSKINTEKAKKITQDISTADEIAHTLVEAAEQTIKGAKKGALKKAEVMTTLRKLNITLGLNVPDSVLDAAVEAAVKAMNDYSSHIGKTE